MVLNGISEKNIMLLYYFYQFGKLFQIKRKKIDNFMKSRQDFQPALDKYFLPI